MGVAVFPLNITGFKGARNIRRNPSHMEISKEGKREREREGRREEGRERGKEERSYLLSSFIFIRFFKSSGGEQTRVVCKWVEHICCEIGWNVY